MTTETAKNSPSIGLALGGGGARGLAHVVVLEAFDSLGLRPSILAGSSMGALVGALYAAGLPAREIRAHLLRTLRNRRLVLGRILEARVGRFVEILTQGLVNPVLIDVERALSGFWPGPLPATFAHLAIPLLVIATDLEARTEVVLRSGPLTDALAASAAVPGLVRPVRRDGRLLIDGGTVNPLPYDHLIGKADLVIACDVSPGRTVPVDAEPAPLAVLLGAAQIMQTALTNRMLAVRAPDLLLRPPVGDFRLLDYFYAARIMDAAATCLEPAKRDIASLIEDHLAGRRG